MKKGFDKVKYIKDCEGRLKDKFDVIDDVALSIRQRCAKRLPKKG